jgi:hypothetical protein
LRLERFSAVKFGSNGTGLKILSIMASHCILESISAFLSVFWMYMTSGKHHQWVCSDLKCEPSNVSFWIRWGFTNTSAWSKYAAQSRFWNTNWSMESQYTLKNNLQVNGALNGPNQIRINGITWSCHYLICK